MRHALFALAFLFFAVSANNGEACAQGAPSGTTNPPPGDYVLQNRTTGQVFEVIITPQGQIFAVDPGANPQVAAQQAQATGQQYRQAPLQGMVNESAVAQGQVQQGQYGFAQAQLMQQQGQMMPQQSSYAAMQQQQAQLIGEQAQLQGQAQGQTADSQTPSQQGGQTQSQQGSKMAVVGNALKGALGMYYNYKYGGMMGGYPGMGYSGYYPTAGYMPTATGTSTTGGIGSFLKSVF